MKTLLNFILFALFIVLFSFCFLTILVFLYDNCTEWLQSVLNFIIIFGFLILLGYFIQKFFGDI